MTLWLALRFVDWALDCRGPTVEHPALVVETAASRQRVIAASPDLQAAGVIRGMDLADARIRVEHVDVHLRRPAAEHAAMARLAGWAWGYSHRIHWAIAGADVECARLVLEIGASLRLFGGRRALLARIRDELRALGYRYRSGVGATPQAALAHARALRKKSRPAELHALPLSCLNLPADTAATLSASGMERVGDLLALPPAALVRRFSTGLLEEIERLHGRRPHGLALYQPPARYRTRHELAGPVETTQGLLFVLRRVFDELALFVRSAGCTIQTLRLSFAHEREPASRLTLRLAAPSNDADHLERITRHRLSGTQLSAPVLEIRLVSDRLRHAEAKQKHFWRIPGESADDRWPALLDRLRARLGHDAVRWIGCNADHRPEQASLMQSAPPPTVCSASNTEDPLPRPLWLLTTPQPIDRQHAARLTWIAGPERIESGWWDTDASQRRDYYRAIDARGQLLWVFRDLTARNGQAVYYLHGLFG